MVAVKECRNYDQGAFEYLLLNNNKKVGKMMIVLNSLMPSQAFRNSLVIYTDATFERLRLPKPIQKQLKETGLPLHSSFCVFDDNPITFYQEPQIRCYALIQNTYLEIAEMAWVGKIAIDLASGYVWQIFEKRFQASFMNSSIAQYVECLGAWLQFYPQFQEYICEQLKANPSFSLFDDASIYVPIRDKISVIDPEAMKNNDNYWSRCCEPDIV